MRAVCPKCRGLVPARYVVGTDAVVLARVCPQHGASSTTVTSDIDYFTQCLSVAKDTTPVAPGVIVELLDGCNMRCPTCIAASGPELDNRRSPVVVAAQLRALAASNLLPAVLLSGGEPTIHPNLHEFMSAADDTGTPRRILITNGVRMAASARYTRSIVDPHDVWEVFLQFDSLREDVLRDLRGEDLRHVRARALEHLGEAGAPTTLVCVVKAGMNDGEVADIVEFAIAQPHVVGLQFQPMKDAGRAENYRTSQRGDASSVRAAIHGYTGRAVVRPHPQSPLSVGLATYDRTRGMWDDSPLSEEAAECFIDPTRPPDGRLRVTVMEYADSQDWTSARSSAPPYAVLQRDGNVLPVDDHFLHDQVVDLRDLPMPVLRPNV